MKFCKLCHGLIKKNKHRSVANYNEMKYCSRACSNKALTHNMANTKKEKLNYAWYCEQHADQI